MHRTVLVGSPREGGRCAHLADAIFNACIEDCPDDGVSLVSVAGLEVVPCIGCDACKRTLSADDAAYPEPPEVDDPLRQMPLVFKSNASAHQCFRADGMRDVRLHLDAANRLILVAPLYFAGAPAQLKAVLDRLQPYYWSDIRSRTKKRRAFEVHVVGEGGNPYGFEPLVVTARSALGVAGFKLERVLDWTGCITEDGQITEDATEYVLDDDGRLCAGADIPPDAVDVSCASSAPDEEA